LLLIAVVARLTGAAVQDSFRGHGHNAMVVAAHCSTCRRAASGDASAQMRQEFVANLVLPDQWVRGGRFRMQIGLAHA
jgi:hypothetical protein